MSHKLTAQIVSYCDILLFSLLRGSGLKSPSPIVYLESIPVLPLTREWIEMAESGTNAGTVNCSPSYEGVD